MSGPGQARSGQAIGHRARSSAHPLFVRRDSLLAYFVGAGSAIYRRGVVHGVLKTAAFGVVLIHHVIQCWKLLHGAPVARKEPLSFARRHAVDESIAMC